MQQNIKLREFAALIKTAKWLGVHVSEKKQSVSFDQERKRALHFSLAGCFPLVVAPLLLLVAFNIYDYEEVGWIIASAAGGMGFMMLVIGAWFLYSTNKPEDRYLFDFGDNELIEFKKKRGAVSRRVICSFADLDSVVLYPRYSFQTGAKGWYFGLSLITKAGSLLELVPKHENRSRDTAMEVGLTLSSLLNIEFQHGAENTIFEYKQSPEGLEFEFVPFEPKAL